MRWKMFSGLFIFVICFLIDMEKMQKQNDENIYK